MRVSEVLASSIKAERLQTRESTNSDYIDDIAERMQAGDTFPPIVIFSDGKKESWLPDGIHRLDAAIKAKKKISVEWRKGTRNDAIEYACGANASHGMRRTNADKRRTVKLALKSFPDRSSRAIAGICCVGNHLVEEIRQAEITKPKSPSLPHSGERSPTSTGNGKPATRVGSDGKKYPASKVKLAAEPEEEPEADEPEPVDPNSLEAVQADLHECEKQIRACAKRLREALGMEGDEFKRPWCGLYSKLTLIHPLEHVARTIKNDMPVAGSAKKPILFHEQKAASLTK